MANTIVFPLHFHFWVDVRHAKAEGSGLSMHTAFIPRMPPAAFHFHTDLQVTQFLTTYFLKRNYTVASAQDHQLANRQGTTGKEES